MEQSFTIIIYKMKWLKVFCTKHNKLRNILVMGCLMRYCHGYLIPLKKSFLSKISSFKFLNLNLIGSTNL